MKRKPIWKELNLPPPAKKTPPSVGGIDPGRQEAAQQTLRSNCVRTLLSALSASSTLRSSEEQEPVGGDSETDPGDVVDQDTLSGLADAIERELFLRHGSAAGQEYKASARTLVAGLKRNTDLRRRVVAGAVRPSVLVAMDARQLATSQQQEEYARLQEQETRRVTLAGRGSATVTSEYTCSRCGSSTCDYMDSGRRDIGKCETWGSKDGQGSSRLVTCMGCGKRWEVDDV